MGDDEEDDTKVEGEEVIETEVEETEDQETEVEVEVVQNKEANDHVHIVMPTGLKK